MKSMSILNIAGTDYEIVDKVARGGGGSAENDVMYQMVDEGYYTITGDDVLNNNYRKLGTFTGFTMPNLLGNFLLSLVSTDSNGKRYACEYWVNIDPQQGFFTVTENRGNFCNVDNNVMFSAVFKVTSATSCDFGLWAMPSLDLYNKKSIKDSYGNEIKDPVFYDNLKYYVKFLSLNCDYTEDVVDYYFNNKTFDSMSLNLNDNNLEPDNDASYLLSAISLTTRDTKKVLIPNVYDINKINYSTEEQVIGTWIDGKPLYQKTIEAKGMDWTIQSDKVLYYSIESLNVKVPVQIIGTLVNIDDNGNVTNMHNLPYYDGSAYGFPIFGGSGITFTNHGQSSWRTRYRIYIMTIQYTKTTD